jgi:ABC-type uncharacterized transport system permease subunit
MPIMMLNMLTLLLYSLAAAMQWVSSARLGLPSKKLMMLFALPAILGHAYLLHYAIDTQLGQNLSVLNLASLACWLMMLMFTLLVLLKPVEKLGLILFPLAAFSVVLAFWIPGQHVIATANDLRSLLHILLAVVTFSVLAFAGIQAILLALQDRQLRAKNQWGWLNKMPPLETMENLLFQMIGCGFLLLTALLLSSFYFYHAALWTQFFSKALVTGIAWLVFAVLILGRKFLGWRGKKALYCTAFGVMLVLLLYFGVYLSSFS